MSDEQAGGHIQRLGTTSRSSKSVIYSGLVFIGGQTADDWSLDFAGQLRQTLSKLEMRLAEARSSKRSLLSAQVWLKDIGRDFATLNEIWCEWLPEGCAPTRATAECALGRPDILVEIIVTAAVEQE